MGREKTEYFKSKLLGSLPKGSICSEIGVWEGSFSKRILEVTDPLKLHLIDPWLFAEGKIRLWYGGKKAKNQDDMDGIYRKVCKTLNHFENVVIHKGFSKDVLSKFEDNYFDWVYIDGDHSYEGCKIDLEFSLLKVKNGGLITGDDFRSFNGVTKAVEEIVKQGVVEMKTVFGDSQFVLINKS